MNYRTYRKLGVVAVLLLVGIATPASLAVQSSQSMHTRVTLIAVNSKFVTAEEGGGGQLIANREDRGPWASFYVVYLGDNYVALRASNGQYVSATGPDGLLLANRDCIGPTEMFLMERRVHQPGFTLKASNGKFVCAENGGGSALIANRNVAAEWETFYMRKW